MAYFFGILLVLVSILLMFIILLQRGRGGGLAGAFGGMGGQSAFGTKAGDVFTRITIGLAVVWVLLAGISIRVLQSGAASRVEQQLGTGQQQTEPETTSGEQTAPPVSTAPADSGGQPATTPQSPSTEASAPSASDQSAPSGKATDRAENPEDGAAAQPGTTSKSQPGDAAESKNAPADR